MQLDPGLPREPNRNALHRAQLEAVLPRACAHFQLEAGLPKVPGEAPHREAIQKWV
jgi:hypothetical protein